MPQRAAAFVSALATSAAMLMGSATLPASAVLNSPNAQIARSVDAALRRSIPAFNGDVKAVQKELEDIAYLLRIPQVGRCDFGDRAGCGLQGCRRVVWGLVVGGAGTVLPCPTCAPSNHGTEHTAASRALPSWFQWQACITLLELLQPARVR